MSQVISDTDHKVKEALEIWAEWTTRSDSHHLGYGRCVGFEAASTVSGWDSFEHRVDKNMAINVQALYEGLNHPQQLAIDHFHLAAVWRSNRSNLEDDYANAIACITAGLKRRGLI